MNILFFGAGTFGLPTLAQLAAGPHRILGVVTSAEKPAGRGLKTAEPPVRALAREKKLETLELGDVNSAASIERLKSLGADAFVVVSFGSIFSQEFLGIPPHGCINLHASLLPKHRGAAPIVYALLSGDTETGVTTMRLVPKLDAGDILLQDKTPISPEDDAVSLTARLAEMGAPLVARTLDGLEQRTVRPQQQDESKATLAPKLKKDDARIDWSLTADEIARRVRAFAIWPGTKAAYAGKEVTILRAAAERGAAAGKPGTVLQIGDRGLGVAAGSGMLWIQQLKPEGRSAMSHRDFANGFRVQTGSAFGGKTHP